MTRAPSPSRSPRAALLVALTPQVRAMVVSQDAWTELRAAADITQTHGEPWEQVDLPASTRALLTGWGTPPVTAAVLDRLPALEVVLHSAGSVRHLLTPEVWERGIRVATAAETNNQFVAEYTVAQILLALKGVHTVVAHGRTHRSHPPIRSLPGTRHQRIGLVSYGSTARRVRHLLRRLDAQVWTWDPHVDASDLAADDVQHAPDLATLFDTCQVVSLHTPLIPGVTEGLIGGDVLARLRPGATFINTARGAVVDEPALVRVLQDRPDVTAVLDVTWPEPPVPDSPLWDLPNVQLTGHVAGALGTETLALGDTVVAELRRHLAGEPLRHELSAEAAARSA